MTGDHGEAMSWAETANERDPNGVAGMRSLGKAAAARGDLEKAHWAFEQAGLAEESRSYTLLVSAKELIRAGRTSEGLGIITRLESEGYEPAQRFMLEYRSGRS